MKSELEKLTGLSAGELEKLTKEEIDNLIEINGGPDIMGFVGKEGGNAGQ